MMPDDRRHRGPHPADHDIFGDSFVRQIRSAVSDLSWLLTQGYARKSALKLVGDRYQLVERQRTAVMRCSCNDESVQIRKSRQVDSHELVEQDVAIDGFNLLTTIEAALSKGVLIRGRDGCLRDMASMHGTYRTVNETVPALELIGRQLSLCGVRKAFWVFDRPVSNSGRLSVIVRKTAEENGWDWATELHDNPDTMLIGLSNKVIVSADSFVIENSQAWWPLANAVVEASVQSPWIVCTASTSD